MIDRRTFLHGSAMLSLAACSAPQDVTRLRIGFQRNGVLFIARTRGEIDRRVRTAGYGLDWVEFPSGPPLIEAMNAGAVDFGAVGDTPAVYAQAAGVPVKLVAAQVYLGQTAGNAFLTLPTRRLRNVAALNGRKIGFTKGSSAEVAALSALEDAGLTIGDVTPVTLAPGDGVAALGQGSIDALFTWDPYFTIAQDRLQADETRFDREGLLTVTLFLARDTAIAAPAALHRFLDELRAEAVWANANQAEVRTILAGAAKLSEPVIAKVLERLGPNPFRVDPPNAAVIANQQRVANTLLAAGSVQVKLDPRRAVDFSWSPPEVPRMAPLPLRAVPPNALPPRRHALV
ncbi:ABC transporter substrate-binding protein [Sandarakinorhabdus sp. DWP1-3-1]|uniref:ABC transporter substrate-binding protein n=1 Tax=Sandarakinorhabdus sp. DWP1-3-1 TaxID=2804627 RepID=UPI003CF444E9